MCTTLAGSVISPPPSVVVAIGSSPSSLVRIGCAWMEGDGTVYDVNPKVGVDYYAETRGAGARRDEAIMV